MRAHCFLVFASPPKWTVDAAVAVAVVAAVINVYNYIFILALYIVSIRILAFAPTTSSGSIECAQHTIHDSIRNYSVIFSACSVE